ncbi:MAG: recombination protein RecR [Candidatus Magasanikbacteria bacterium CG10_big_fil_rev_8_21_14_0_10_40_10]|uniref:Recombination protein RecR n=1 Tax=Candidatus Magasanikbacteria bacterium CG10_big_fil_rev_8_21_14_0_10_40_10 TaxID=1974648 RepID=A0A2M6W4L7_9BACT|nr:MAG: recombination protein RecR [Candidatus Magasanikbacteria bacterium CG10_big_fil_rev_8_21_14_0_10_40_10]
MYAKSIENLIDKFKRLPGIGQKGAERFVFYLLKNGKKEVVQLGQALDELIANIKSCRLCWNFVDSEPCPVCANNQRNKTILCVLAQASDLPAIESTGEFKGRYFILRGLLDYDLSNLKFLKIKELLERLETDKQIQEIILAFNPNLSGETTAMYLQKQIIGRNLKIKISRLARGLPMNGDLQYADQTTLSSAIKNRS